TNVLRGSLGRSLQLLCPRWRPPLVANCEVFAEMRLGQPARGQCHNGRGRPGRLRRNGRRSTDGEDAVDEDELVVFDHFVLDYDGVVDGDAMNGRSPRLSEVQRVAFEVF